MRPWILFGAFAALVSWSGSGQAQGACGSLDEIAAALERTHGERQAARGLSGGGALVELFTATDGSWTLLYTLPGGPTCLLAAGEAWESRSAAAAAPKTPPY